MNTGPGSPPPTHLVTIDPATGAVTDLGASLASLDAIAFTPIPEPTALALIFGTITAAVAAGRRR
jgi:hypothetical protein